MVLPREVRVLPEILNCCIAGDPLRETYRCVPLGSTAQLLGLAAPVVVLPREAKVFVDPKLFPEIPSTNGVTAVGAVSLANPDAP